LPRANQKPLGREKTLGKDFFAESQLAGSWQKKSLPSAIFFSRQRNFKNHFYL
jgi:hypothetical protein